MYRKNIKYSKICIFCFIHWIKIMLGHLTQLFASILHPHSMNAGFHSHEPKRDEPFTSELS